MLHLADRVLAPVAAQLVVAPAPPPVEAQLGALAPLLVAGRPVAKPQPDGAKVGHLCPLEALLHQATLIVHTVLSATADVTF